QDPYVEIHAPEAAGLLEEPLPRRGFVPGPTGHVVVPVDVGPWGPPGLLEHSGNAVEIGLSFDRDLGVDDVLRGEPGHRGGTDVVDPSGVVTDRRPEAAGDVEERLRPPRVVFDDLDLAHARIVVAARQAAQIPTT